MNKNKITLKKIRTKLKTVFFALPGVKQLGHFISDTYERKMDHHLTLDPKYTIKNGWSVVITSDGKNPNDLAKCIASIENELQNSPFEIIIVGPKKLRSLISKEHIKLIEYRELLIALAPGWITFKKNIGVRFSQYDKIVLSHDYVMFKTGWKKGFDLFGDSFDVCINRVSNPDGSRHRDWLVWDYPNIGATYLPYDFECTEYQYISGTYFVVKRDFYMKYPLDEKLRWGESEDVEWSKRIRQQTTFKFNPGSEVVYTKMKIDPPVWMERRKKLEQVIREVNDNNKNFKIDVIIPVYNGSSFVLKAIQSVVNQTVPPQKIIVINDGSTDNTEEIVLNYAQKSPIAIEYFVKKNGGPSSARNVGIIKSSADLLAFLDADDEWLPPKLERQLKILKNSKYKNLGLIYCSYEEIDENNNSITPHPPMFPVLQGNIFEKLLGGNFISSGSSGVLIRKKCFEMVDLFDETLKGGEDWDMWLRIAEKYNVDYTREILVRLRSHPNHSQSNRKVMRENGLRFYNKWIKILSTSGKDILVLKIRFFRLMYQITTHFPSINYIFAFPELRRKIRMSFFKQFHE